jgi:hypothetical protein
MVFFEDPSYSEIGKNSAIGLGDVSLVTKSQSNLAQQHWTPEEVQ